MNPHILDGNEHSNVFSVAMVIHNFDKISFFLKYIFLIRTVYMIQKKKFHDDTTA